MKLHLSTIAVVTLLTGAFLGINLVPQSLNIGDRDDVQLVHEHFARINIDGDGNIFNIPEQQFWMRRGWPRAFHIWCDSPSYPRSQMRWSNLVGDLVIALLVTGAAGFILEFGIFARNHARDSAASASHARPTSKKTS